MDERQYVQVAFPIPVRDTFTYIVPDHLRGRIFPGCHVTAFLGQRKLSGIVVGSEPREGLKRIKPLESLVVPEPVFDEKMLELTRNVADYYLCPWGEILAAAYPAHAQKSSRAAGRVALDSSQRAQHAAAGAGVRSGETLQVPSSRSIFEKGAKVELVGFPGEHTSPEGMPDIQTYPEEFSSDYSLESELSRYFESLLGASEKGKGDVLLLHLPDPAREGVYPFLAAEVTKAGGSVLFLVPEVSTSSSLVEVLNERFGELMALFHSRLRISERKRIWEKSRSGMLRVLVGTRSAVFLPLRSLRLIVVEDEHAQPLKQEETPRYNARDVAIMRARLTRTPVLLASATPSVESVMAVKQGRYQLLEGMPVLKTKPTVTVVDMRKRENLSSDSEEFSFPLISGIQNTLEAGKKVLLFLNRRGFSTWVQCQECGVVEACHVCDLPLVYHSYNRSLLCHHCGYQVEAPSSCRRCGGIRFWHGGVGVEKVHAKLKKHFPKARIAGVDLDSTRSRPDVLAVARRFAKGEIDILIGTLIVTKGLKLGEFSLAGVLHAEAQLNIPDFRSGERAFQLLSEVVSLAQNSESQVIIQSLNPEHHSVLSISSDDPNIFYEEELTQRGELGYPPFSTLIAFYIVGPKEEQVLKVVRQIAACATSVTESARGKVQILGPSPAIPVKLRGRVRWHMSIRGTKREDVVEAAREILSRFDGKHEIGGVTLSVDVDPVSG